MKTKIRLIATCAVLSALLATSTPTTAAAGRVAEILHEYTPPPFSLANFGYTAAELAAAQANGLTTTDHPAIGSGLHRVVGTIIFP